MPGRRSRNGSAERAGGALARDGTDALSQGTVLPSRSIVDLASLSDCARRPRVRARDAGRQALPWFMTLFGRDSLITATRRCRSARAGAATTLGALAGLQATAGTTRATRNPGRCLHELRRGEADAALGGGAHSPYYGRTTDAAVPRGPRRVRALDRRPDARPPARADARAALALDRGARRPRRRRLPRVPDARAGAGSTTSAGRIPQLDPLRRTGRRGAADRDLRDPGLRLRREVRAARLARELWRDERWRTRLKPRRPR